MQDKLNVHGRNRSPLYVAMILALSGASAAGAADTAPDASNQNGLMTFPNVRVVNAPQRDTSRAQKATQPGMRAYVDPDTGQLIQDPTQAQIDDLNAAVQVQPQIQTQQAPTVRASVYGGVILTLGESSMEFATAHIADDGTLTLGCVSGEETANALIARYAPTGKKSVSAVTRKGIAR